MVAPIDNRSSLFLGWSLLFVGLDSGDETVVGEGLSQVVNALRDLCWICREFVRALERAARALSLLSQRARQARMLLQDSWPPSRISARLAERAQPLWDS
jgi:hypothetical protein